MPANQAGSQPSLFPDDAHSVAYEQPLTERIRTCLRLEHLFQGIETGIQSGGEWNARDALQRMLEVCDFLVRTDVKAELIKELERNVSVLNALRDNPGVNPGALDDVLESIVRILEQLKQPSYQPGARLRNDELASQVRQRISIPGGTCNFDVPALHFWLSNDGSTRNAHLNAWMQDLRIVESATRTILNLIRESSSPRMVTAPAGFYQQQLDANAQCQIVRVVLPAEARLFPEISGGKHRFTVRFYGQRDTATRPVQVTEDVRFELQCCGI